MTSKVYELILGCAISIMLLVSCSVVRDSPKYNFASGQYISSVLDLPSKKVYVDNQETILQVYALKKAGRNYVIDTLDQRSLIFTQSSFDSLFKNPSFRQTSFDIDFLSIPFKYRFSTQGFPRQFNATLNGGVYLGYRTDFYALHYKVDPLGKSQKRTNHFGISVGGFSGLGGTAMNPSVTNSRLDIEYDGVVWTNGIAAIVGLNNLTVGLALGWDQLLDTNRQQWLYQRKPWLGVVFGLNLN